jgi:hypothetical protein
MGQPTHRWRMPCIGIGRYSGRDTKGCGDGIEAVAGVRWKHVVVAWHGGPGYPHPGRISGPRQSRQSVSQSATRHPS